MGTVDNSTQQTFQITTELQTDFDAVRPIFASTDTNISHAIRMVSASAPASAADLNNSSGTWVQGFRAGLGRIYAGVAPGVGRICYSTTDWIYLPSRPRTDGGKNPLVSIRAFFNASSTLPAYGNGADSFTNWATRTDGRKWVARQQAGLHVTTTSGFTTTANLSQSPIVGVQYLARGKVITVAAVGDSITDGRGSYLGEGFIMPVTEALTNGNTAVEYMNCGWSTQTMAVFAERAIDVLESPLKPSVLVMPAGSPNDVSGAITQAHIDAMRGQRSRVQKAAKDHGVPLVLWTWLPSDSSVKPYGTSDSLRTAYNAEALAQDGKGFIVADTAAVFGGATSGGQIQIGAGLSTDGIHPNDAGNAALRNVIRQAIQRAMKVSA
jgi:lysophospholipase L1-like esterase